MTSFNVETKYIGMKSNKILLNLQT